MHFRVFLFRRVKAGVKQARSARHARREKKQKNSLARVWRSSLALLLPSCLPEKATLVMLAKKSLGKLKATLLKKKKKKKKKRLRKSCSLLRYKVHVIASQKLLIFSYIIEMLSPD